MIADIAPTIPDGRVPDISAVCVQAVRRLFPTKWQNLLNDGLRAGIVGHWIGLRRWETNCDELRPTGTDERAGAAFERLRALGRRRAAPVLRQRDAPGRRARSRQAAPRGLRGMPA